MTSRLLQQFLAIAELGSLTAASAAIGISQPALTKNLRQLETELGVRLFHRRPRGVVLTAFGEILQRRARLMEREYAYAMDEIGVLKGGHAASLRIGAGPVWRLSYLPSAIVAVHKQLPDARIDLRIGAGDTMMPALCAGEIDLYAGALRDHADADHDLVQEELMVIESAVISRAGHPLAAQDHVTPMAMSRFPWVLFPLDAETQQRLQGYFQRAGAIGPKVVVETTSYATGLALVRQGDYLALLARPLLTQAAADGLIALPTRGTIDRFAAGVTYRRSAADLPVTRLLLTALRAAVALHDVPATALASD